MKPLLSVIIPAIPGRIDRLAAILSRLTLNQAIHPNIPFEVVVLDGGSTDDTPDMCAVVAKTIPLKYIYVPINGFINASYPRNVALRATEGEIIGHIDIDHWPSEHLIFGMTEPFVEQGLSKIINRGYVLDSSKSEYCKTNGRQFAADINAPLLMQKNMDKEILDVFKYTKIPGPGVNNTLWVWAVKREFALGMSGYDENYIVCYCREDDDWRERLLAKGLRFYDGQNKNFCAIHLWHPAKWREEKNDFTKKYFQKHCCPVREIVRNKGKKWGRMLEGSYSIIGGVTRNPKEHEEWVAEHIKDAPSYIDAPTRKSTKTEDN